jgi:hypothetical protein
MNIRRHIFKLVIACMCLVSITACSTANMSQTSLSGHYFLSDVMETGSELLLQPNGAFKWYMVYGAVEMEAEGKWGQNKTEVMLVKDAGEMPFKSLRIETDTLIPIWSNGKIRGKYTK